MLKHRVSGQELIHIVVSLQKKHLWQSYNNVILSAFNPAVKPRAVWDTFVCGYKVQAQSLKWHVGCKMQVYVMKNFNIVFKKKASQL